MKTKNIFEILNNVALKKKFSQFLIGAGFCTVFLSSTIALLVVFRGRDERVVGTSS